MAARDVRGRKNALVSPVTRAEIETAVHIWGEANRRKPIPGETFNFVRRQARRAAQHFPAALLEQLRSNLQAIQTARMEQMAVPGSILVSADTLKLAEGYVQVKQLGPLKVKGLELPLEVFEITGAGKVRSRLRASASRGLTRFVGRQGELNKLGEALDRARTGHGQVVAGRRRSRHWQVPSLFALHAFPSHPGLPDPRRQLGVLRQGDGVSANHRSPPSVLPDRGGR
jgi:hypothetical protein